MAEPLKNQFGADVPEAIAAMVAAVHPGFPRRAFLRDALQGYDALELMPRGRHIAQALHKHLPADYPRALEVLLASAAQPSGRDADAGMASFLFLPHTCFVAHYGLAHFEPSMHAMHVLTQRFTAEFAIRPFLLRHPQATLQRLAAWARDPSEQVRRLVSEGTRPRLPWAPRLPMFQADPAPVLRLLELLKDDPSLFVRRSVANNLNDIGKDHPQLLAETARRWLHGATPQRAWIVRHALRWAVKQGAPWALDLMGFGARARVAIERPGITPARPRIGGSVALQFDLHNPSRRAQQVLVDLQLHYVKAGGGTRAKVFKLAELELQPGQTRHLRKKLSLAQMTTRKHYPGTHRVEVLVNGQALALGSFALLGAAPG